MKRTMALMVATLLVVAGCGGNRASVDSTIAATTTAPATTVSSTSPSAPVATTTASAPPTTMTASTTSAPTTASATAVEITLPDPEATHYAIVNATIITATGARPIANGVVVVDDGRIAAVGAAGEIAIPTGAALLDAGGGHVMPGLIDTHTHILDELVLNGTELDGLRAGLFLETPLSTGLTTFRDVGSAVGDGASVEDLRAAIAGHDEPIPTIVMTGPVITRSGSEAERQIPDKTIGVAGPEEATAVTNRLIAQGVDQIKVALEQTFQGVDTLWLNADEVTAITTAAHEHDMRVTAHVGTEAESWVALDGGVDELAHWPDDQTLSDELIAALAETGTVVTTTFDVWPAAAGDLRRMLDAGVTVVMGTGAPGYGSAVATWRELGHMVSSGATPMEAILASTRDAAVAIGLGDEVGTIELGKAADLLVLAGDPLTDVLALQDVAVVIKNGQIVR